MNNKRYNRQLPTLLALVSIGLASCGSGWGALTGVSSNNASPPPVLTLQSQNPTADNLAASPSIGPGPDGTFKAISFSFNLAIDEASLTAGASVRVDANRAGTNDYLEDNLDDILVNGNTVTLIFKTPMSFNTRYDVHLSGGVKATDGTFLDGPRSWMFCVRDGALGPEEFISFLDPIGQVTILPGLGLLTVIESSGGNEAVVGVSEAPPDGNFAFPQELFRSTEELNQGGIFVSAGDLRSVVFLEGDPRCGTMMMPNTPHASLFVSQYFPETGSWEGIIGGGQTDARQIDSNLPTPHISWQPRIEYDVNETTVAVWWAWTEFDADETRFLTWQAVSAHRERLGEWTDAEPIDPDGPSLTGWPFLGRSPDGTLYALWGLAGCRTGQPCPAIFDEDDEETYTSYQLATWVPAGTEGSATAGWSRPVNLDASGAAVLPLPTDFVIVDNNRAVVLGRSLTDGPVAIQIDLPGSPTGPALGERLPLEPVSEVNLGDSEIKPVRCSEFNDIRSFVANQLPTGSLAQLDQDEPVILVAWFGRFGSGPKDENALHVSQFEFGEDPHWRDVTTAVDSGPDVDIVADVIDANGNITLVYLVRGGGMSQVRAARLPSGSEEFHPLGSDGSYVISGLCSRSPVVSNAHPSGLFLVGWSQQSTCGSDEFTAIMRRFE